MEKSMNNNGKGINVNMIIIAIMGMAMMVAMVLNQAVMRYAVCLGSIVVSGGILFACWLRKRNDFVVGVVRRLNRDGIKCKVKDEMILVKKGDLVLRAKVWNRPEKGSKRIHFTFEFAPAKLDAMSDEGWAMLTAMSNAKSTYTTVKYFGDHMACQVETTVKTAKDFVREYEFAYNNICDTIQAMEKNTPEFVKHFAQQKERHMGFRVPSIGKEAENEAADACEEESVAA